MIPIWGSRVSFKCAYFGLFRASVVESKFTGSTVVKVTTLLRHISYCLHSSRGWDYVEKYYGAYSGNIL